MSNTFYQGGKDPIVTGLLATVSMRLHWGPEATLEYTETLQSKTDYVVHFPRSFPSTTVVYKLKYSCGHSCFGQTQRNLKFRLDEHNPLKSKHHTTDVVKHLIHISRLFHGLKKT